MNADGDRGGGFTFARRMKNFEASGIRKIFDRAQKLTDAVDLSIGQPDFDAPGPVKSAAIQAIRAGHNRYTVTQGLAELHAVIRGQVKSAAGVEPEAVLVTGGTAGALLSCLMVLVEEGTEVLIPDPYFVMYKNLVALAGGTPKFIDTYPDFRLTPERLRREITPRSRLLIFNNPVNPTGVAYSRDEVAAIAQVARDHNLVLLADEIYDHFSHDFPHTCALTHHPQAILVNGFSKNCGVPGWRLGYAAGPRAVIDQMTMVQQFTTVCAPAPFQRALLSVDDRDLRPQFERYRRKRDRVYDGLRDCFEMMRPQGAFYAFPRAPGGDAAAFVERAIENKVLIVPGEACSRRNTHFRISYAVPDPVLDRGIDILRRLARG